MKTNYTARMFALGLAYFLADGVFPVDFVLQVSTASEEDADMFLGDIMEAAEAIEDMGLDSVQQYLSAYHLGLETGIQLVTVEYDMSEGASRVTYTA